MIVVDTNVIAYLLLPGEHTEAARRTLLRDPDWAAPLLWRSEYRSVLSGYVRRREVSVSQALELFHAAVDVLGGAELEPEPAGVLRLVAASRCSAYDCEFVALAQELSVPLVTGDVSIVRDLPDSAVTLEEFAR